MAAAALGRPVVAPYTCTKIRLHGPYGGEAGAVATTVPCRGSYLKRCDKMICMDDLIPERLWPRLQGVLSAWQSNRRSACSELPLSEDAHNRLRAPTAAVPPSSSRRAADSSFRFPEERANGRVECGLLASVLGFPQACGYRESRRTNRREKPTNQSDG